MGRREDFTVGKLNFSDPRSGGSSTCFALNFIPPDGTKGFGTGSRMMLDQAALGMVPLWVNVGTTDSCKFRPFGPQIGWGIELAAKKVWVSGTAGLAILVPGRGSDAGDVGFAGYYISDDQDSINSTLVGQTDNAITITNSADPLSAHGAQWGIMRQGGAAAWDIVFAGTKMMAGGAATDATTLTGALATDLGFACYSATDDTDSIQQVVMTANTMTVTMSANPLLAHGIHYMVLRPRGMGKPSHYIAYAAKRTTAGGSVSEAISVPGALATDVAITGFAVTDDTDQIVKSVLTKDTLTITAPADPGATHAHWYMILRAYPS